MGRSVFLAVSATLLAIAGCAPRLVQTPAIGWPEQLADRTLFRTGHALLFACAAQDAGEIDELIQSTAAEFTTRTSGAPTTGLVFVTDSDDPPVVADVDRLLDAMDGDPNTSPSSASSSQPASSRGSAAYAQMSVDADRMLRYLPIEIPRVEAGELLGLDPDLIGQVQWIVVLPTRDACRKLSDILCDTAVRQAEITFTERLLMMTMLPLVKAAITDELRFSRRELVFKCLVMSQHDWSDEQKSQFLAQREQAMRTRVQTRLRSFESRATAESGGRLAGEP